MNDKINGCAYEIVIDESSSRFFIIGGSVWVYDLKTNEKIARLNDISYPTYVSVSHKNNIVLVQSTDGRFAFYTADTLVFLGKLKIRGSHNTDEDFYYDEEENAVYGIYICGRGDGGVGYGLAEIYPDKLQYSAVPLPQSKTGREKQGGKAPYTRYCFVRHAKDGYYLIRNRYAWDASTDGLPTFYDCCYGRFEKEGDELVLKEKLLTSDKRMLELSDIPEGADRPRISELRKRFCGREYFIRTRKSERGWFAITNEAVYRLLPDGAFEEICREQFMSDYAEFGGRRYICTWKYCLVQDLQ